MGSGNGEFHTPYAVSIGPNDIVLVADQFNHRLQFFTPTGSFLGKVGNEGSGDGEFKFPYALTCVVPGERLYVADSVNYRVQYFRRTKSEPAVEPTSLGRIKALFD
jgi:hypothetical protein